MIYVANPVRVKALRIIEVLAWDLESRKKLVLEDGSFIVPRDEMLARIDPNIGDYVVEQGDGYTYLNPRDVFERKYSPAPSSGVVGLTFGLAIAALKRGSKVSRAGWNGKGMWLANSPGSQALPAEKFWAGANREYAEQSGGTADVLPCITMKTATGEILMGWLASQTDMLAEDWGVVE